MKSRVQRPALCAPLIRVGMRVAVACSGGADSVALLRALLEAREKLGVVVSAAHVNHAIRGAESDGDERFVTELAGRFDLALHLKRVDTPTTARLEREGLEEAARKLRYQWFWQLLENGEADAVVTAHTLDDQTETVLHRLLRGAWTEGLAGIHPVLRDIRLRSGAKSNGVILRPFLGTTRKEIEDWLHEIGQPWREDSSNADTTYTRNRIRHELLPALQAYNPKIKKQFAQMAALARDEESYWEEELERLLPSLLLTGKAVRGGGRATDTLLGNSSLSIEIERLRGLHPALRRRVVRAAGATLGFSVNFEDTERLLGLCGLGESEGNDSAVRPGMKLELEKGLRAERTARELRLLRAGPLAPATLEEYSFPIPGMLDAAAFGLRIEASVGNAEPDWPRGLLRSPRAGDRVRLRYRHSPMKLKDALKQAGTGSAGAVGPFPVLEWRGEIVWVGGGIEIESGVAREAGLVVKAQALG